jgi:multiple sugar transport system substrate-binding protein
MFGRSKSGTSLLRLVSLMALITTLCSLLLSACGDNTAAPTAAATTAAATTAAATTAAATTAAATTAAGTTAAATTAAGTTAAATTGAATTAAGTTAAATTAAGTSTGVKLNTNVAGKVELWHFWSSPVRRNAIRRVVAICQQALPKIQITETFKPFGDIYTANTAAVAAGTGMPDVIVEDRPQLPQKAANNIETDLQALATRDGIDGSAYWPFTWNQTLYKGDTYGIPFSTDTRMLYYSKNAFKEVGLDPEKPPTTWSELEAAAAKLDKKNADGTYARLGFSPLIAGAWDQWATVNGAEYVTKDGRPNVNDPKVVEALSWMKKWVDKFGNYAALDKFRNTFTSPPNDAFMSGKVAMVTDINGYVSQLNFYRPQVNKADGSGKENLDWGIANLPHNDAAPEANYSGGFALSIPRGSKNQDAAWEFIKCATSENAVASWARDTYEIPANIKAANDPTLTADPNWVLMLNALKTTKTIPFASQDPNYGQEVDKRTRDVFEGKKDAKAALDEAQAAIDAAIAKNK